MTTADIERLYAFNRWANARTLGAAEKLSSEQLHRDLKSSFPSVQATLVHMLGGEWIWLQRWNGTSPATWPDQAALRTVADLRAPWQAVEQGQSAVLAALTDVDRRFSYRNMKGDPFNDPIGLTLQHVVNHATYHRGQVTTMLRQLGAAAEATDFISFARETVGA